MCRFPACLADDVGNWNAAMTPTPLHLAVPPIAAAQGVDPQLVEAIALVESGGRPDAFRFEQTFYDQYIKGKTSCAAKYGPLAACSFGAMQILLETACELGYRDHPCQLFFLPIGLSWGTKYLASLLDWSDGNQDRAILAYNAGKGAVELSPPYRDQAYLDRVQRALKGL